MVPPPASGRRGRAGRASAGLTPTLAGNAETPVYRLAPSHDTVPPPTPGKTIFALTLTRPALTARYAAGARIITHSSDGRIPPDTDLLFLINPEGTLIPVTTSRSPDPQQGDTLVLLGPEGNGTARVQ